MLEIAMAALTLGLSQDAGTDPWVKVDGEWLRPLTCTVDTNEALRMPDNTQETTFILDIGDEFGMILHGTDEDGFTGISLLPPTDIDDEPIRARQCDLLEDGTIFRCNIEFLTQQVADFYGNLDEHRFHVIWLDNPVEPISKAQRAPSYLQVRVTSGECLD